VFVVQHFFKQSGSGSAPSSNVHEEKRGQHSIHSTLCWEAACRLWTPKGDAALRWQCEVESIQKLAVAAKDSALESFSAAALAGKPLIKNHCPKVRKAGTLLPPGMKIFELSLKILIACIIYSLIGFTRACLLELPMILPSQSPHQPRNSDEDRIWYRHVVNSTRPFPPSFPPSFRERKKSGV